MGCIAIFGNTKISFPPFPRVQPTTTIPKGAAGHREWPCVTNAPALAKAYNLDEAELDETPELGWHSPNIWREFVVETKGGWIFWRTTQGLIFLVEKSAVKTLWSKREFLGVEGFFFKVVALEWIDSSSSYSCILENIHSRKVKFVLKKRHLFTSLQSPSEPCVLLFRADGQLQSKANLGAMSQTWLNPLEPKFELDVQLVFGRLLQLIQLLSGNVGDHLLHTFRFFFGDFYNMMSPLKHAVLSVNRNEHLSFCGGFLSTHTFWISTRARIVMKSEHHRKSHPFHSPNAFSQN